MKSISEYMDLDKIIKRLQDIDKLKMLLFDQNQQNVFEMLPKPGISTKKNSLGHLHSLSFEAVASSRKLPKLDENRNNLEFLLNGDKVNKKMLDLLGPAFSEELNLKTSEEIKEKITNIELCESRLRLETQLQRETPTSRMSPKSSHFSQKN